MSAYQLFRNLSREPFWSAQSAKMRWIACRYYAGVESYDDLMSRTLPRPVMTNFSLDPDLTREQAGTIIRLR